MEVEEFFREGKWLPTFALLSGTQLVHHFPSDRPQQPTTIRALNIDKDYPARKDFCESTTLGFYQMVREVKAAQGDPKKSIEVVQLRHLREILEGVISNADGQGMRDEHAIVYLVWKFMAVLISL